MYMYCHHSIHSLQSSTICIFFYICSDNPGLINRTCPHWGVIFGLNMEKHILLFTVFCDKRGLKTVSYIFWSKNIELTSTGCQLSYAVINHRHLQTFPVRLAKNYTQSLLVGGLNPSEKY